MSDWYNPVNLPVPRTLARADIQRDEFLRIAQAMGQLPALNVLYTSAVQWAVADPASTPNAIVLNSAAGTISTLPAGAQVAFIAPYSTTPDSSSGEVTLNLDGSGAKELLDPGGARYKVPAAAIDSEGTGIVRPAILSGEMVRATYDGTAWRRHRKVVTENSYLKSVLSDITLTQGEVISGVTLPEAVFLNVNDARIVYALSSTPDYAADGISFAPGTRILSGTPTAVKNYAAKYTVTERGASGARLEVPFTIKVVSDALSIGSVEPFTVQAGVNVGQLTLPAATGEPLRIRIGSDPDFLPDSFSTVPFRPSRELPLQPPR